MLIKGGLVLDFDKGCFTMEDIRVCGSKITEMAPSLAPQAGEDVLDASGSYITPGLIDAHSHLLISEEGMGSIGDDCCDYSDALTPHLEVLDGMYPFDRAVERSARAGVTSVLVCPGSDGVIGGVCSVAKLKGTVADEMLVLRHAAMKGALGENPKTAKHGFASRMGVAYTLRKCLEDAKEYQYDRAQAQKNGSHFRKDPGMENMALVLEKKMPLHLHVHRSDDICTAIRIGKEYDLDVVLIHCTDGIAVADYIAKSGYPAIVGPSMGCASKNEVWAKSFETAGVLSRAGVKVCLTADHDVTPLYYLPTYAEMAARYGMDQVEALKAVTLNPAQVLRIDDRKGSLQVGKDADLVLWNAHPFDVTARARHVFIEGEPIC